jgi:hypothetical protein
LNIQKLLIKREMKLILKIITLNTLFEVEEISSISIELITELLIKRYKKQGKLRPEAALNAYIRDVTNQSEGMSREEAIMHLFRQTAKDGTEKQVVEQFIANQPEIEKLREKIDTLTLHFSAGEISEDTYFRAVKKIEDKITKLQGDLKIPPVEKRKLQAPSAIFRSTMQEKKEVESRIETIHHYDSPSSWWWLAPLFFGIPGGIFAYIIVKDADEDMAESLLLFSVLSTIILAILGYIGFFWFLF